MAYPGAVAARGRVRHHGHYLDCHLTIPTLERLTMGAMERVLRQPPPASEGAGDYESICAPMYAWRDAVARDERTGAALNGIATVTAWRALRGRAGDRIRLRTGQAGRPGYGERPPWPRRPAAHPRAGEWRSRSPLRPSTEPAWVRCAADISRRSFAARAWKRWARWPTGSCLGRSTSCSGTPTAPAPCPVTDGGEWRSPGGAGLLELRQLGLTCRCSSATLPADEPLLARRVRDRRGRGPPVVKRLLQGFTRAHSPRPTAAAG